MNYLTNYYKNLSEQLQEKVNVLHYRLRQLNEVAEPPENKPKPPEPNTPNADPVQEPVQPAPRRPMTDEEYQMEHPEPKVSNYDRDGDGVLSDEEYRAYFEAYFRWRSDYLTWQLNQLMAQIDYDADGIDVMLQAKINAVMQQMRELNRLGESVAGNPQELDWDYWKEIWKTLFGKTSSGYNLEFARWMWEMMRRQRGWDIPFRNPPGIGE